MSPGTEIDPSIKWNLDPRTYGASYQSALGSSNSNGKKPGRDIQNSLNSP